MFTQRIKPTPKYENSRLPSARGRIRLPADRNDG